MLDNLKLVTSADQDLTSFGYTIQDVTGCALEVPHGRAPQSLVMGVEQWESWRDNMYQKKKMVEDLCTIVLGQPVSFEINEKQDFEYWY